MKTNNYQTSILSFVLPPFSLGQLIRMDNGVIDYTFVYEFIQGSTFGLSYEWALHNFAALLGIGGEQATSLDVGASIFADGRDHNFEKSRPEVALMSIAMRASYMIITSPLIWIRDMRINGGF